MAIYTVSDLHGQFDTFEKGLEIIDFGKDDYLYVLGDAIDRGPDGIRILWHVMQHHNMDLLIGNHEFMMLNSVNLDGEAFCDGDDTTLWLYPNGGVTTFEQYIELNDAERSRLIRWLRARYVVKTIEVADKKICLTHSYYDPACENKRYSALSYGDVWNIVWSSIWREDELSHAADIYEKYAYTFITGHVPVQTVRKREQLPIPSNPLSRITHGNLINIDGGCAMGKRADIINGAIFLRLDDFREFTVRVM